MVVELSFVDGTIGVQSSDKNQPVMIEAFRGISQFIQAAIGTKP
jgi:hypothetical protein